MHILELDSYNLSDTVKFHDRLNPRLWDSAEHLRPEVADKLMEIARDFQEFMGVPDLDVVDITISGSNAAYNYTGSSDIDLHLVINVPKVAHDEVYRELFNAKKYEYNDIHNIRIGGADVELYAQDSEQPHHSQGIYSLLKQDWISVPRRRRSTIDDVSTRSKYEDLAARIDSTIKTQDRERMVSLMSKIKTMRRTGLEKEGEFGSDNLAFKLLRNNGYIKRLIDARNAARDAELSLAELAKPRQTVRYGFTNESPDGVNPTTKMFLENEPADQETTVQEFISHVIDRLGIDPVPEIILHSDPAWSKQNQSFGRYNADTHALEVNLSDRHIMDILRTVAHELVHCRQNQSKPLPDHAGRTGSAWENDANARAGVIMRQWAEERPEMFDGDTLEESAHANLSVPPVLYHATYRPLLRSIKRGGLGGPGSEKKKWEDSIHGAVYLALDPHVAESYAETSDSVPDDWLDEIVILQISTAGLNPSKFMLDRNVRDNAGDTVEYHGIIPLSNISVLKRNMSEASGYIPTKKQAKDPRFVMALTRDVRPGAVGKEANKLGLKTDANGKPALLMKSANTLAESLARELELFEEQDLFEINMGSKNLRKEAAKTGALAGMEFEMIVPNTETDDNGGDQEPDWDQDEQASSPSDIRDFFYDSDFNSRRDVDRLIDSMMEDYGNWQVEAFGDRWDSDSEQFIYDYIKENMDDDEVRELLELDPDQDITRKEYQLAADKIAAEQIEPWYEDAKNDASDSFYEDDQFEEWLANENLDTMSGIAQNYDIQWPHYTSSGGGNTSINDVAEDFSQAVGRPARASDSYHAYGEERPGPGKNFYVVEPDGSLEPDDPQDAGLEFVSPPLPIDDIMSDLNKVKKWADRMGCYTNQSTGLHINISVPNYDLDQLDFVKLALLMGDEYVLEQFGRASNTYAKSALGKIRSQVGKGMNGAKAKAVLEKMTSGMDELAHKAIHSGVTEKYTSINTKDGHVEFRSPGGDWLGDNFDKIENTLLRFTVALSAAMDPQAYREEYLKKLYKILNVANEGDILGMFARYAAGQLPKQALKSFVRQAQADRQAKKSGEEIVGTPAAGVSTTTSHPQGRGRPNDPTGRYAIVRRDDQRNYSGQVGSEAPDYQFRFTLPDGYSQAQIRSVRAAWAARENVNADDYIIVDTTQFAAPEQTAAPESGSVRWNIINSNNEIVHSFWNRNVQADANAVAREWFYNNDMANSSEGPFEVVPAAIPGSTLDLQRQRMAADAAANTRRWADYEASQTPTPIAGVQDIEPDVEQYTSQPAQTQWEVYDRSTGNPVFRMYAANQAEAWRKGQEWVANYARMTPDQPIDPADYSVRQSAAPVSEGQDRYGNFDPPGPESPPKMPAGTIKVDVSDMYDWYKLGQKISDLKSIDKSTLGKGPPSTVFAFGSEDLENMYSHELSKLGLKTHDLDEPGEEDVDEQIVNELKINNATGVGAVPYNQEIDYHGLRVAMRPSMFLRLALPLDRNDPEERKAIEYCKSQLDDQGIGAPFLTINVPAAWESDDFSLEAKVRDHDGRHRCYAILDKEGDQPIEVHLLMSGGLRRRHISDNMIKNLRNGILNQQGQYVSGPIFDTAQ